MSVRWDAVVDRSRFWTGPSHPAPGQCTSRKEGAAPVTVNVWLYGSLASVMAQRPLPLPLSEGFTLGEVFAELDRRYGKAFSDRVIGADGKKFSHCRVFVDGLPADDFESPAPAGPSPAMVEIILLTAIEGG
ncbi:MAG: MoaD/ThiS family protein [Betaproteobacteria bacterium]|nr:MoaD/ThiS family protein [Betaproteobacteria bacterium]